MIVIKDNRHLPKPALQSLAVIGWAGVLYLAYVVGLDSGSGPCSPSRR